MALEKQVEHDVMFKYMFTYTLEMNLGKGYNVSVDISICLSLYHPSVLLMAFQSLFYFHNVCV